MVSSSLPCESQWQHKARHDKMVEMVTRIVELKKQQARAPKKQSPSAKQLLDLELAMTDHQVDALVYELYGLTAEEIRIVEMPQESSEMSQSPPDKRR